MDPRVYAALLFVYAAGAIFILRVSNRNLFKDSNDWTRGIERETINVLYNKDGTRPS